MSIFDGQFEPMPAGAWLKETPLSSSQAGMRTVASRPILKSVVLKSGIWRISELFSQPGAAQERTRR